MKFYDLHNIVQSVSVPRLRLQWDYNTDTFKSWLMSEVAKDIVKDLDNWAYENKEELPFHDMFAHEKNDEGPVTRTVIPFDADPNAISILKKIQEAGLTVDFKNGVVTNGKRQIRLGKYILSKISPFTEQEKEWWTHAGQAVAELQATHDKDQYAIVVSRNPIDIVRMSDHDGWTSCHAPGREYFQCAIADAKGAGAIAYVVKKEDLAKINLQDPEIFKDKKRGIDGVSPVSRVRLRKFVHKEDGYDLAVPEDRTYGKQFPGLEESVRKWAYQAQQGKLKGQRPRLKDFQLMGGSYQDTMGGQLFNHFFGDDLDHGDAEYGGEDEYQNMVDQYEEEVAEIEREFRNKFTICSFYADVQGGDFGDQPYVSYGGTVHLEIPEEFMIPQKKVGDDVKWTETPQYKAREAVRKWARENDIYTINDVEINDNEVRIDIYDEDGMDPDSFRSFLDNTLYDIDKRANELQASLYRLFVELGLAKGNKVAYINNNWDEHPHQFTNFKWEGDDPEVMVSLSEPIELPPAEKTSAGYQHEYKYWQTQFSQALMKELNAWADKIYVQQKMQPSLFQEPEFQPEVKRSFKKDFKIVPIIKLKPGSITPGSAYAPNMYMYMTIEFETFSKDEDVDDVLEFVSFLDKNYNKFVSMVGSVYHKVWVANWGKPQPQTQQAVPQPQQQPAEPEKTWYQKNYPNGG